MEEMMKVAKEYGEVKELKESIISNTKNEKH